MTARLPTPGSDDGTWGNILNEFLLVSHNADGTLQTAAVQQAGGVTASQVGAAGGVAALNGSGLVPRSQLGTGTANNTNYLRGDGTWQSVPAGQQMVITKSGAYTLTISDDVVLANANGSPFTLTLPTAVGNTNLYNIKKIDNSANAVTVATSGGQTIDGGSTAAIKVQYASVSVVSDGANWYII